MCDRPAAGIPENPATPNALPPCGLAVTDCDGQLLAECPENPENPENLVSTVTHTVSGRQ